MSEQVIFQLWLASFGLIWFLIGYHFDKRSK